MNEDSTKTTTATIGDVDRPLLRGRLASLVMRTHGASLAHTGGLLTTKMVEAALNALVDRMTDLVLEDLATGRTLADVTNVGEGLSDADVERILHEAESDGEPN